MLPLIFVLFLKEKKITLHVILDGKSRFEKNQVYVQGLGFLSGMYDGSIAPAKPLNVGALLNKLRKMWFLSNRSMDTKKYAITTQKHTRR